MGHQTTSITRVGSFGGRIYVRLLRDIRLKEVEIPMGIIRLHNAFSIYYYIKISRLRKESKSR